MSFTMKMLALSVLLLAMMALTRGAAPPVTEPPPAEKAPATETVPSEDVDELGSGTEEEEEETDSTPDEGKQRISKRDARCPCGWSLIKERCYHFFPTLRTWAQAQLHCHNLGANLASVRNGDEENDLKRLAGSKETWIGFSDAQEERHWFWIDGSRVTHTNWCRGQPDNHGSSQHCTQFNWSGGKCWDDENCLRHKASICVRR